MSRIADEGGMVGAQRVERLDGGLTKEAKRLMVPGGCRAYMRKTLVREFPAIVQGFVEAAKTGSCPHVKLVTELMRPVRQRSPRQKKGPVARYMEERAKEKLAEEQERLAKELEQRSVEGKGVADGM